MHAGLLPRPVYDPSRSLLTRRLVWPHEYQFPRLLHRRRWIRPQNDASRGSLVKTHPVQGLVFRNNPPLSELELEEVLAKNPVRISIQRALVAVFYLTFSDEVRMLSTRSHSLIPFIDETLRPSSPRRSLVFRFIPSTRSGRKAYILAQHAATLLQHPSRLLFGIVNTATYIWDLTCQLDGVTRSRRRRL